MKKYLLLLSILFLIVLRLEAATLHTLIVCDITAEDISDSVESDFENMQAEVCKIANYTQMDLNLTCLLGVEATPRNVMDAMTGLVIDPDDVVIFYFSGHGYRTYSKVENFWPNLFFCSVFKGLDFDWVIKELKNKQPRFVMAIADCCNIYYPEHYAPLLPYDAKVMSKSFKKIQRNYRKLFLEYEGAVLIAGAKEGKQSWSYPWGGIFTNAFLKSLKKEVESSKYPDWQNIVDRAGYKVQEWQTPIYVIEGKRSR